MSPIYRKSTLARLTSEKSAVVCLGFAQTAGGRYRRPPSKKPKATDLTTAVDHGNVSGASGTKKVKNCKKKTVRKEQCADFMSETTKPCRFDR